MRASLRDAKRSPGTKPLKCKSEALVSAFMVNTIKPQLQVSVLGSITDLSLKDAGDGCIGVSLWFDTLEHALKYADYDTSLVSEATYKATDLDKITKHRANTNPRSAEASPTEAHIDE